VIQLFEFKYGKDQEGSEGFIHTNHKTYADYPSSVSNGLLLAHDIYEHYRGRMLTIEDELIALGGIYVIRTPDWEWNKCIYKVLAEEIESLIEFSLSRGLKHIAIKFNSLEKEFYENICSAMDIDPVHKDDSYYLKQVHLAIIWVIHGIRLKEKEYAKHMTHRYVMHTAFEQLREIADKKIFKADLYYDKPLLIKNNVPKGHTFIQLGEKYDSQSWWIHYN
jgi:hypothetical protein